MTGGRKLLAVFCLIILANVCSMIAITYFVFKSSRKEIVTLRQTENRWIGVYRYDKPPRPKSIYPNDFDLTYDKKSVNICKGGKLISLLFMVHTAPGNVNKRKAIRNTFANKTFFPNHEIRTIFLIGTTDDNHTQSEIEKEQTTFGDIVQAFFHDSYRNLTLKAVTGFKWISENCANVSLVVKIDDDVFVQTFHLLERIFPRHQHRRIFCNVWQANMPVLRKGKWKVEDDELKMYKLFPWAYCSGFFVVITGDLVPLLYKASLSSAFLWVDDVYFSGILTSKIENLQFEGLRSDVNFTFSVNNLKTCYTQPDCSLTAGLSSSTDLEYLWRKVIGFRNNISNTARNGTI